MQARPPLQILAGALLAAALATGAHADSGSFGDWAVVCDNTRVCEAFGFGDLDETGSSGYIVIRRDAGAAAAPTARLVTAGQGEASLSLAVDGRTPAGLGGLPARPLESDPDRRLTELTPAQTQALLPALVNGARLSASEAGRPALELSLAGSSASLRFMDDRQKRAGTLSALVARGARGLEAVPPPPAAPVVTPAPAVSQAGLPEAPPAAIAARLSDCDEDLMELGLEPAVARLAEGRLFWALACSRGAYNVTYRLFLSDEAGGAVEPLRLAYPSGEQTEELMNIAYDPQTRTLANFDKGRGLGDCGAVTEWRWTGEGFELAEQVFMPECRGVPPEAWPVSYRSR